MNFLDGPYGRRQEVYPYMIFCGKNFFGGGVYINLSSFSLAKLQEKGGLNSQQFQVRRDKNWKC